MKGLLTIICIVLGILYFISLNKISELNKNIESKSYQIEMLTSKINEAVETIENANNLINDAKGDAWASYDEMGDALENLQEIESIEP